MNERWERQTTLEMEAALHQSGLELREVVVSEGVVEIADGAFLGMENLERVQLPKSLRKIGALAFYGCKNLKSIDLPKGLKEIGTAAFKDSGLTKIEVPIYVSKIESEVFANTPVVSAEIKGRTAGMAMFRGCASLKKVVLSGRLRVLEREMLRDCIALKTIRLSETLCAIGENAFHGCSSLSEVTIPQQVAEIGEGAFYRCGIRHIELPDTLRVLQWQTFAECRQLKTVYLPRTVVRVESEAFSGCDALAKLCLEAALSEWGGLEIGAGNTPLLNANIRCGVRREEL